MKHNRIIRYSILFSKSIYWLCILFFFALIGVAIYWHFNAQAFSSVGVADAFIAGYGINGFQYYPAQEIPADTILLSDLNHGMLYWIVIRAGFFVIMTLLIIKKILSVLTSIEDLKTFYLGNIQHFREMARLSFIAFLASCINFSYLNGDLNVTIGLVVGPLALGLASLVLAEVFQQGKELLEEQNMII